jgi:hypothetical protein
VEWSTVDDWSTVIPLLPVTTVEGDLVWFMRCQMRTLRHVQSRERITQFRSLPVSAIWISNTATPRESQPPLPHAAKP